MRSLSTQWSESHECYDGRQLAAHWIYRTHRLLGDALVAWEGPADVPIEHMVDLEDVEANAPIASPRMLHFVGEWFSDSLELAIAYQWLFVLLISEELTSRGVVGVRRRGNDLYVGDGKLSVSIATASSVSVLAHWGINVETDGTPVRTSGLSQLGIEPRAFAELLLTRFAEEFAALSKARAKVLSR